MVPIPDRTALAAMLRPDIQKLCKDNNIKANMRTEDMIDALCGLANGQDVPRTQRAASMRTASITSRPPSRGAIKAQDGVSLKKALQPSESNTDAESATETPAPAPPTTRRRAREIQIHLGKGRPALVGGSGARAITKPKKTSATVARRHDPIPEEDEENPTITNTGAADAAPSSRPASPEQLPTPAPSHPSHSLPSAPQLAALEARIVQLETAVPAAAPPDPHLQARLRDLETSAALIPALEARLAAATQHTARLESDLTQLTARLGAELERVGAENGALKERVTKLEARLQSQDNEGPADDAGDVEIARPTTPAKSHGKRIGSMIIHSPEHEHEAPVVVRPYSPPAPSPSQPTLGKRARGDDTPDVTGVDSADVIDRIIRPVRKRARVGIERKDELSLPAPAFAPGGPSSTSTPRARPSDSPPGFFTVGRRAPTPLARRSEDLEVDMNIDAYLNLGDHDEPEQETGPSNTKSPEAGPSKTPDTGPSAGHGTGFFGSPPPVLFGGHTTPSPLSPEMYATPALGAPWRHTETPPPPTPLHVPVLPHPSTPLPERDPGAEYTFRGGRRERNDRYNPYFTPGGQRTGLTPPALGSPANVDGESEAKEERLRTLYGTELEGDTRFGDFGKMLGRWDWGARGGKK